MWTAVDWLSSMTCWPKLVFLLPESQSTFLREITKEKLMEEMCRARLVFWNMMECWHMMFGENHRIIHQSSELKMRK